MLKEQAQLHRIAHRCGHGSVDDLGSMSDHVRLQSVKDTGPESHRIAVQKARLYRATATIRSQSSH
jgi:hypothetical protein